MNYFTVLPGQHQQQLTPNGYFSEAFFGGKYFFSTEATTT
jgi:hypothetical protein